MSFLARLRSAKPGAVPLSEPETIAYRPIGHVRNHVRQSQPHGWEALESDIVLRPDLERALEALDGFSHVIVVFHMHGVPESEQRLRVTVGNEDRPPKRGVLATRSQLRPNAIGVSVVRLLDRNGWELRVKGLDALDGTPVLDVKPYLPEYDAVPSATLPRWAVKPE